jgi:DNA-binding beta-propeller fold protein YncE
MGKQIKLAGITFANAGSLPQFVLALTLGAVVSTPIALSAGLTTGPYDIAFKPDGAKAYLAAKDVIVEYNVGAGTSTVVAGVTGAAAAGTDGIGAAARFGTINSSVVDGNGQYAYFADGTRHTIRRMDTSTYAVTTVAGQDGVAGNADGTGTAATFNSPYGISISADNSTLFVTCSSGRTAKIVLSTGAVTTPFAASNLKCHVLSKDGSTIYATDGNSNVVKKIIVGTGVTTIIAGSGVASSLDGNGVAATFNNPWGIEIDPTESYLYVTEFAGQVLRRINLRSLNTVTTVAGLAAAAGSTDGTGSVARFNQPLGLQFRPATATSGSDLYICGYSAKSIRKVV